MLTKPCDYHLESLDCEIVVAGTVETDSPFVAIDTALEAVPFGGAWVGFVTLPDGSTMTVRRPSEESPCSLTVYGATLRDVSHGTGIDAEGDAITEESQEWRRQCRLLASSPGRASGGVF